MAPINDILADLPFGSRGGHLQIKVTRLSSVPVQQFLTRLKKLSSTATANMDFDQMVKRFKDLSAFMDLLRKPDDPLFDREKSDRHRLLDVRRHVQVSALEVSPTPGAWDPRISCWLILSALEAVVAELLAAKCLDVGQASMRSKLTCLQVAYATSPEIPARAQYAWSRLSEACHQHAYQLSPTYSEAEHLLEIDRGLEVPNP